jgi:hypothetical protein
MQRDQQHCGALCGASAAQAAAAAVTDPQAPQQLAGWIFPQIFQQAPPGNNFLYI